MFRVILAFLAAPFIAALAKRAFDSSLLSQASLAELLATASHDSLPVYIFGLPIGLGLFILACKVGRVGLLSACLAGAAIAALFFVPSTLEVLLDERLNRWYKSQALSELFWNVLFGASVGLVAWVLGIWRNPAIWHTRLHPQTPRHAHHVP